MAWIQDFFEKNGPGCNAVIGISGGKDSSVAAALAVRALGKERVFGVLMPCGVQADIDAARKLQEMENAPEIIFFDLPGTMDNEGVLKTVASMDYIFCPAIADRVVMQSSLAFAKAINDHMITTGRTNIKGLYFVWNMVDGREKTGLYDIYDKVMAELGLSALKTFVPDSKRFRREGEKEENRPLFRSTLFPPDKTLIRGSNVRELAEEVLGIING